jgi:hypothetical protein
MMLRIFIFIFFAGVRPLLAEPAAAVPLIRKYCQACHGVGDLRFITSEKDSEVWEFIFRERTPKGVIWAEEMIRVLDWPTNSPPANNSLLAPGRDWMPKGKKRYDMVEEHLGDEDAREFLLRSLREDLLGYL